MQAYADESAHREEQMRVMLKGVKESEVREHIKALPYWEPTIELRDHPRPNLIVLHNGGSALFDVKVTRFGQMLHPSPFPKCDAGRQVSVKYTIAPKIGTECIKVEGYTNLGRYEYQLILIHIASTSTSGGLQYTLETGRSFAEQVDGIRKVVDAEDDNPRNDPA